MNSYQRPVMVHQKPRDPQTIYDFERDRIVNYVPPVAPKANPLCENIIRAGQRMRDPKLCGKGPTVGYRIEGGLCMVSTFLCRKCQQEIQSLKPHWKFYPIETE